MLSCPFFVLALSRRLRDAVMFVLDNGREPNSVITRWMCDASWSELDSVVVVVVGCGGVLRSYGIFDVVVVVISLTSLFMHSMHSMHLMHSNFNL